MTATPLARRSSMSPKSRCTSCSESDEVGSSMITTRASNETARAISMSWTWETDRSPAWASGSSSMPMSRNSRRVSRRIRSWSTNPKRPRGKRPSQMFSMTLRAGTGWSSCWIIEMPARIASDGRREADRLARQLDLAGVGLHEAGQHVHERRLAGAVLAAQGVDGAGAHGQVDRPRAPSRPGTSWSCRAWPAAARPRPRGCGGGVRGGGVDRARHRR